MASLKSYFILFVILVLLLTGCGSLPLTPDTPDVPKASDPLQGATVQDFGSSLIEFTGTVEIWNPGQIGFSPASNGMRLEQYGQVRTGSDGIARFDLSSGTTIRIGAESMFTLQSNQALDGSLATVLDLVAGQVWVILRGGRLQVTTPSGTASVFGSYLSVFVDPLTSDATVTCLEGSCQATNPAASLDLVTGQGAALYYWDVNGTSLPPSPHLLNLTQSDFDQFLVINPEAQEIMANVAAAISGLPPQVPPSNSISASSCFELVLPANASTLAETSPVQFDWGDQAEAFKYIVTLTKPDGGEISRIVWSSSLQFDPLELAPAGIYTWSVTAFDSNIQPICTAGPWVFNKTVNSVPAPVEGCFVLTSPVDGTTLPDSGPATFSWTEQPGRYKYIITITKPSGEEISLISWTNSYIKDLELLPEAGNYQWKVTAYDSKIQSICSAGPWTFTKNGSTQPPASPDPTSCVTLLTPADGVNYPDPARVDFTWTEYPGAYKYIITFKPPSTPASNFLAWTPTHTRYIESFTEGGTYQWWVTVKNSSLQELCTSQVFTFAKPETSQPSQPTQPGGGSGLFWNQNGPTGGQSSCGSLHFSVNTSNTMNGMIKVVYSKVHSSPDGNSDPHIVIGNTGATSGSGSMSLPDDGSTINWRFAIYNGSYTYDSSTFSFTCPGSSGGGGGGGGASFSGQSGPTGPQASCALLNFTLTTSLTGMAKIVFSTSNSTPDGNVDPHLVIGESAPGAFSHSYGDFSSGYSGSTVYWRFAVYNGGYIHDSNISSFTCP